MIPYDNENSPILNTSSGVNYYYNKNSKFKKQIIIEHTYSSHLIYKTKKIENSKVYTNGKYKLITDTYKNGKKGVFKHLTLVKVVYETRYTSIKNPYFNISKKCNWTNPTIKNLAEAIKANVTKSNNVKKDIYNTELANAVIRYVHTHIKYDYNPSSDQSAIATLKRGNGSCVGNSMLAGALLRALGIPTYFEASDDKIEGHIWPVSYIFYENSYQWIPAETTYDFTDDINYETYYSNLKEYRYPFQRNALNEWIIDQNGKYNFSNIYGYNYNY